MRGVKLLSAVALVAAGIGIASVGRTEPNAGPGAVEKRGCCSHHKGVCGCSDGRAICCDGSPSPTCGC